MGKFRILSIDGGGIRGIVPGVVLTRLEDMLGRPLAQCFDLIAGTSTGGILACLYLAPDDTAGGDQPRFSAAEALALYLDHGEEIFANSAWFRRLFLTRLFTHRYPAAPLEEALASYLDDLWLSDLVKPCLVPAFELGEYRAFFFTQHTARERPDRDFPLREVARATAAAPTYFEPAIVTARTGQRLPMVDGGVFANNPALCAYAEARKFPGRPTAAEMVLVSVGSGFRPHSIAYKDACDWGLAGWAKPLIGIMMSGVADTVDYQLRRLFEAAGTSGQYVRLNPQFPDPGPDPAMDAASPANMAALKSFAEAYVGQPDVQRELEAIAGTVTD